MLSIAAACLVAACAGEGHRAGQGSQLAASPVAAHDAADTSLLETGAGVGPINTAACPGCSRGAVYAWYFEHHTTNNQQAWGVKIGRTNEVTPETRMQQVATAVRNHVQVPGLTMKACTDNGNPAFNNFFEVVDNILAVDTCLKTAQRSQHALNDFGACANCAKTEWFALTCPGAIAHIRQCIQAHSNAPPVPH